ncbi:MAG: S8 family serine peptidase [Pseudoclavibacter sp.]
MKIVRNLSRVAVAALTVGLVVGGFGVGAATAAPAYDSSEKLSGRLSALAAVDVSSDPAVAEQQLATASPAELALPESGPASLQLDGGSVAVTVYYSTPPLAADIDALAALGTVDSVATKYLVIGATVPVGNLEAVAGLNNVQSVQETLTPATSGSGWGAVNATTVPGTEVDAPGDPSTDVSDDSCRAVPANLTEPLNVPLARELYGVDGEGVRIGIISDSFDFAPEPLPSTPAEDVAAGLLPGPGNPCGDTQPVEVLRESPTPSGDEGRAMAQLIYSIAPGATLLFASGSGGQASFANAVETLSEAGADIIVDDLGYYDETMFQDGVASNAMNDAVALGIPFFTAAGNDTVIGSRGESAGRVISSWETPEYRPTACPAEVSEILPEIDITSADCMDFDPGAGVDATNTLTYPDLARHDRTALMMLQWAEPQGAATNSMMVVITDSSGELVGGSPVAAAGSPVQIAAFQPTGGDYNYIIVRDTSDGVPALNPRVKTIFNGGYLQDVEYSESVGGDIVGPSIFGHAGTPSGLSIVAADASTPTELEEFSGTGPMTLYFEPFPSTNALPEPISGAPTVTSLDGGWTNFFGPEIEGQPGVYSFTGTSAAAPSAAAVAALGMQLSPGLTPQGVRDALTETAIPIDSIVESVSVADSAGAGLVDAVGFLAALPGATPTPTPTPTTEPTPTVVPTPTSTAEPVTPTGVPVPGVVTPTPATTTPVPVAGDKQLASTGADETLGFGVLAGALALAAGLTAVVAASRRRVGEK